MKRRILQEEHQKGVYDETIYKIKAEFLKQLAHPVRLEILEFLKSGEHTVTQIRRLLHVKQSSLSKHLGTLRALGILGTRREKNNIFYRIENPTIFKVIRPIADIMQSRLKRSEELLSQRPHPR